MVRQIQTSLSPLIRSTRRLSIRLTSNSTINALPSSTSRSISTLNQFNRSSSLPLLHSNSSLLPFHRSLSTSTSSLNGPFRITSIQLEGRKPPRKGGKVEEKVEEEESSKVIEADEVKEGSIKGSANATGSSKKVNASSKSSSSAASTPPSGDSAATPPSSDNPSDQSSSSPSTSISRTSVPDVYPQVLALPITRRPLFPGFYKAVVIRNPAVVAAIKEAVKRGQPYIGAFLLKDENSDSDV